MSTSPTSPSSSSSGYPSLSSRTSLKRARHLFSTPSSTPTSTLIPPIDAKIHRCAIERRIRSYYPVVLPPEEGVKDLSGSGCAVTGRILKEMKEESIERVKNGVSDVVAGTKAKEGQLVVHKEVDLWKSGTMGANAVGAGIVALVPGQRVDTSDATVVNENVSGAAAAAAASAEKSKDAEQVGGGILVKKQANTKIPTPKWHAPFKLTTVISSHLGWVRSLAFDPTNDMFATGGADRVIKIFDLAKACVGANDALKITLTGHVSPVRGLAFSERHPYLFSAGEDKMVKCWDLETNQVIRHYHGHLSGVFTLALHPTLDILVTGGRDAVARVWDMRTKNQIHCLTGHDNTIGSILTKSTDPQVITGSYDSTIKLWDLVGGKCRTTLTHHKKAVRALVQPSFENTFCSGAADTLKKWGGRDGRFIKNFTGHNKSVINALALNEDGVLLSAADDGTMNFWDYHSGYCFQKTTTIAQPGSLDAENGIFAAGFDLTGTRLITCEADKSIKIWRQDEEASELSHPVDMVGWRKKCLKEAKQRY